MKLFPEAFLVRDKISKSPIMTEQLDALRDIAEKYLCSKPEIITLEEYLRFYKDGNRLAYEKKYFDRRGRLATYAFMLFIYRDMRFLAPLENIIWTICEEFTWVLPAHLPEDNFEYRHFIDLFCAETGEALAEIKYLLGDVLSERVKERIHKEVSERIIDTYLDENTEFWWYTSTNNWSAVCAGSCAMAAMYETDDDKAQKSIEKSEKIIKYFLSGFSDEGVCMEGYSYWNYGFGYFINYATLLLDYTDGKINHFTSDRIKSISEFINGGYLRNGAAINFSDTSNWGSKPIIGYEYFLSKTYDTIKVSKNCHAIYGKDSCCRFATLVRSFVWPIYYENNIQFKTENQPETKYYPDAQWYIKKTPSYILCAKGGNNDEPHNHNDVGSFYIDNYKQMILIDIGSGEYTKDYFREKRYEYFVCSSRGHNLPIINGMYQSAGEKYKAHIIESTDTRFKLDISGAYECSELESFIRTLDMQPSKIILNDSFKGNVQVRERFISHIEPTVTKNGFIIEGISFNSDIAPSVSVEKYNNHKGISVPVYIIEFLPEKGKDVFQMEIEF